MRTLRAFYQNTGPEIPERRQTSVKCPNRRASTGSVYAKCRRAARQALEYIRRNRLGFIGHNHHRTIRPLMVTFRSASFVHTHTYNKGPFRRSNLSLVKCPAPEIRMEPRLPDRVKELLLELAPAGARDNNPR